MLDALNSSEDVGEIIPWEGIGKGGYDMEIKMTLFSY